MADSILFRGAFIRYFDVRQEEGGAFTRLHLTAEFSTPVIEAMDWADPGNSISSANLDGELCATHFILTPGDKSLKAREIQFDINEAADFKVVAVEENESKRRELRFIVRTSAAGVAAKLDEYIRRVGQHQGALKIAYVKQEELNLEAGAEGPSTGKESSEAEEPDTGCVLCNNDIRRDPENQSRHVNGQTCTRNELVEAAATLASAREVNGGTHARKRKDLQ